MHYDGNCVSLVINEMMNALKGAFYNGSGEDAIYFDGIDFPIRFEVLQVAGYGPDRSTIYLHDSVGTLQGLCGDGFVQRINYFCGSKVLDYTNNLAIKFC